jgi:hypothetical protein
MGERVRGRANGRRLLRFCALGGKLRHMQIEVWLDEARGPRWWARTLSFAAVVGVLLGIVGLFGSYLNDGVLMRVLYWSGVTVAAVIIAGVMVPPLIRVGLRIGLPWPFSLAVAMAIADVPITVLSTAIVRWLWAWQVSRLGPADFYSQTLLMSFCVLGLWLLLEQTRKSLRPAKRASPSLAATVCAIESIEPVLCLQMEDHYVRVHRASGSSLELMPLQEAVRRYDTADGLQVHRSWWVAAAAVTQIERDIRNWRLRLINGTTVPVARNRIATIRARGWLDAGMSAEADAGRAGRN